MYMYMYSNAQIYIMYMYVYMYIHVSLHYFAPFSTVYFQEEMPLFKSLEWKVDILNEYVQVYVYVLV